jgi:hypothetical protein
MAEILKMIRDFFLKPTTMNQNINNQVFNNFTVVNKPNNKRYNKKNNKSKIGNKKHGK